MTARASAGASVRRLAGGAGAVDSCVLGEWVRDACDAALGSYADVEETALAIPYLEIVNPPIWELGHVAWFQEHWVLRHVLGRRPTFESADALWNSAKVAHRARWALALPGWGETRRFRAEVAERVLEALGEPVDPRLAYFVMLSVFHEDMHVEAFAYTRQTLGWPPVRAVAARSAADPGTLAGDAEVAGGTYFVGARREAPGFVFDNEKWGRDVELRPFAIARAAVTQAEFAAFVDDGGYRREALWSIEGWRWRQGAGAELPFRWRRGDAGWERRWFDAWRPVAATPHRPMIHVNAFEAEAWARWAGRRLPTEIEWEVAAGGAPIDSRCNLDLRFGDVVDVGAFPESDSAVGCRQMFGNVWEWTSSVFERYPGFERDPYAEYSEPWFGDHRVLRGGCFATRARLLRPTWRNFYRPERRDVWAGFRTCAID